MVSSTLFPTCNMEYCNKALVIIFIYVIALWDCKTLADEHEYRLTRYLMSNYDASVRPSHNSSQPLRVVFGMSLHQIIDVDEKNQILTTNCWLTQIWTDFHLRWNATDFGGIKVLRLPASHVWKPDIILYNNADSQYNWAIINTNVIVNYTGEVMWLSHGIFKSSCDINVEYFPFDIQVCQLKFASWTYDGYQVDLVTQTDVGDTSNYQLNGEFHLDELVAVRNVQRYSCCPEPYPDITFTIKLRRRPMFYVFNLILPCILINSIALLVFYVPSESGEKVTLGISTLLSLTVFLLVVRDSLPPTEKMPLIGLYYGATIFLVSTATGLSVLTLNIYHRGVQGTEVPPCVKKLILGYMAKLMLLKLDDRSDSTSAPPKTKQDFPPPHLDISGSQNVHEDTDHLEHYNYSPCFSRRKYAAGSGGGVGGVGGVGMGSAGGNAGTPSPGGGTDPRRDDFERQFLRVLNKIHETIEKAEMRTAQEDRHRAVKTEWQQVALVCDRFLLTVFMMATAAATFAILFSSPHGP